MAVRLSEALQHLDHSVWGAKNPVLGKRAVREALLELENKRKWRFLQGPAVTLTIIAGQDYVGLPPNFRDIVTLNATDGLQGRFYLVDIGELNRLRTYQQADSSTTYRGALEWAPSTAPGGGAPTPRLAIYPEPVTTIADWLSVVYRSKIVIPDDDTDFVSIPDYMDPVFFQILDAIGKAYAFDDAVERGARPGRSRQSRLEEVYRGPTYSSAVARDSHAQGLFSVIRNASVPRRALAPLSLATQVSPPG